MKQFLAPQNLGTFWGLIKTYIDKKISLLENKLVNKIVSSSSSSDSGLKFFKLSNGGGDDYLTLTFSQPPGSGDMIFVFGRSNATGSYNNSATVCFGIITFEDAYDNVSQGTPVWYGISQIYRYSGSIYMPTVFFSPYSQSGLGTFIVSRYSNVNVSPAIYRILSGPYARLWCLTNSDKIIV